MKVSVTEAKNSLTQLIAAVEKGERVTIVRHGRPVVDIVPTTGERRVPKFGTMRGVLHMTSEQFAEATRPMTDEETEAFIAGR
jgi:prevent-host-death family protein